MAEVFTMNLNPGGDSSVFIPENSGEYTKKMTLHTADTYVDRDIEITSSIIIKEGLASINSDQNIDENPIISWDSINKQIKATYSGSQYIKGTATPGWVTSIIPAIVTTNGISSINPVNLDSNLKAENITAGVTIFGVTGTKTGADYGAIVPVRNGNTVSWETGWVTKGSSTGDTTERAAGEGAAEAIPIGLLLDDAISSVPISGKYIKVIGSGSVSTGTGWVTAGSTSSNSKTLYYPIATATLANTATSGITYTDKSDTAPVLISGDYLYINKGYFDTDAKISLKQLVPDVANVETKTLNLIYKTVTAYDKDGTLITGTMSDAVLGVIASGLTAKITSLSPTYNSTNDNFAVSGSGNIEGAVFANVITTGYAVKGITSKSENASGTANINASLSKIKGSISIGGTRSYTPTLSNVTIEETSTLFNAANGAASTIVPTEGVYVRVKSNATSGNVSASASISASGYGTSVNHGISDSGNVAITINSSGDYYIPIKEAKLNSANSAVTSNAIGSNIILTEASSEPTSGRYITVSASGVVNVSSAGWISAGNKFTNTISGTKYYKIASSEHSTVVTTKATSTNAAITYTTSDPTLIDASSQGLNISDFIKTTQPADGTSYIKIAPSYSKESNGTATANATAECSAGAGYTDGYTNENHAATEDSVEVGITKTAGTSRYIICYTGTYTKKTT